MLRFALQKRIVVVLGAALALAVLWLLLWGPFSDSENGPDTAALDPAAAVAVEIAVARAGEIKQSIEALGTARANEAVTITAKTTGLVRRINFEGGQQVATDTVLVELDARETEAKLNEYRAERDSAKRALERAKALLKTQNVAQARVDELTWSLAAAEARVQAEAAKLADSTIRAPFAGRLGLRQVSLGALVEPGDPITTLDDTHLIKLDLEVPETTLAGIVPGLKVLATSAALPDQRFEGRVEVVDSRIDPVTRSIKVRAVIPNPDDLLKPGMFLHATLFTEQISNAVLIPEEAVIRTADQTFVFAVRDMRAARVPVVLGRRLPGEVAVTEGLGPGETVVIGGVQHVRDGAAVRIRNLPPGQPPGQSPGYDPGTGAGGLPSAQAPGRAG